MVQFLIELDDETAAKLEKVAPARSRRRSEFVREAIREALWAREEAVTREAYLAAPDNEAILDASTWEPSLAVLHEPATRYGKRRPRKG